MGFSRLETVCISAWYSVSHILETLCFMGLRLCVSKPETMRSIGWNSAFHVLKLCVPCIETLRSMYWNDEFHRLKLEWNTLITRADAHKERDLCKIPHLICLSQIFLYRYGVKQKFSSPSFVDISRPKKGQADILFTNKYNHRLVTYSWNNRNSLYKGL